MGKLFFTTGEYLLNVNECDAIINSASKNMKKEESGVCKVIYDAAGDELEDYCLKKYIEPMSIGSVRITRGFNLNKDIIHVLSPNYKENNNINLLINCYINILDEIKNNNYKNILFCSIATGYNGYKHEDIAKPLMILLNNFCKKNDINVYFNNLHTKENDIYLKYFLDINGLNIKEDLLELDSIDKIKEYVKENINQKNVKTMYKEFAKKKEIEDMNMIEKIICLQYTIENYDVSKEDIEILIKSL